MATETKGRFTPGPWHVGPHYKTDVESRFGRIAQVGQLNAPEAIANARLIAAAPELYDALCEIASYCPPENGLCHQDICTQDKCGHCKPYLLARDLLARIDGESR